ncbi:unnamed protein product [marine sediment metagenome]|uniref:Uncharacterized protein n=1 Tax=marine sediment metagenome TaxID=412755 RepID=X1A2Q8_9ZZZZ
MAEITITVPDEQVPRVKEAFAFALGLGSPSSAIPVSTVQDYVVADLKQFTKNAEIRMAAEAGVQAQAEAIGSPQEIGFE